MYTHSISWSDWSDHKLHGAGRFRSGSAQATHPVCLAGNELATRSPLLSCSIPPESEAFQRGTFMFGKLALASHFWVPVAEMSRSCAFGIPRPQQGGTGERKDGTTPEILGNTSGGNWTRCIDRWQTPSGICDRKRASTGGNHLRTSKIYLLVERLWHNPNGFTSLFHKKNFAARFRHPKSGLNQFLSARHELAQCEVRFV